MTDAQTGETAAQRTAEVPGRPRDRRARPRVPAHLPVLITAGSSVVVGTTVDASEEGLAVSVPASTPALPRMVRVALRLPNRGWLEIDGEVVRRQVRTPAGTGDGEFAVLGIRLSARSGAVAPTVLPARGRTEEPRPTGQAPTAPARSLGAELRALASLVYEQAFHDPGGRPVPSLLAWASRLAAGLGLGACRPTTNRELLKLVAALHRRWSAPPARAVRPPPALVSGRPRSPRR